MRIARRRPDPRALALVAIALLVAGRLARAEEPPVPGSRGALRYLEIPFEGPSAGRRFEGGNLRAGIDINSEVDVDFDRERLRDLLLPLTAPARDDERSRTLATRLAALQEAAEELARLPDAYRTEAVLYEKALAAGVPWGNLDPALRIRLESATSTRARIADRILGALLESLEARFGETLDQREAEQQADLLVDPIFHDVPVDLHYDLEALGALIAGEIGRLDADLAIRLRELEGTTLAVELRGHLVHGDGTTAVLALEGHNSVEACVERSFEKLDFALSPEEQELLAGYQGLAAGIRSAREAGAGLLGTVRTAFEGQKVPVFEAIEAAESAVERAGDRIESLSVWADKGRFEAWWRGPGTGALARHPALESARDELENLLQDTRADYEVLRRLGGLKESLEGRDTSGLLVQISNAFATLPVRGSLTRALSAAAWTARLDRADRLLRSAQGGALATLADVDGPVKAWNESLTAVEAIGSALEPVRDGARQALIELRGGLAALVAAELPEPAGQKRREVASDEELDTRFDLRRICGERREGDEVRLQYRFFSGEEELGGGWTDTFRIRVFGWRARALASVALVRFKGSSGDDSWEPTAPISFLLSRRAWPGRGATGLEGRDRPLVSFGISTMTLDFSDDESFETGLAATVGLFDDLALLGYGVNLQAGEEGFFFIALRPFKLGNLFRPARSGAVLDRP